MQVQPVTESATLELPPEPRERVGLLPADHLGDAGVVAQQRSKRGFGDDGDPGIGMALPQGAEQGRHEQNVADGAEADKQDGRRHGGNVAG